MKLEGFPGVTIWTALRPEGGLSVRATLTTHGLGVIPESDVQGKTEGQVSELIADLARTTAAATMKHAAALSMPFVGVDWDEMFELGMSFTNEHGERGQITALRRSFPAFGRPPTIEDVTIQWAGAALTEHKADDVLDHVATRRWSVP